MEPTSGRLRQPFINALAWIIVGWSIVAAILWFAIDRRDTGLLTDAMLIAVASGAIACVSQFAGILIQLVNPTSEAKSQSQDRWGRLIVALAVVMTIRSVGTVALFLTYRYQLASSTEMIAGMTLGWYVFLTSIEVLVLARSLPKTAEPSARLVSIHVDTFMPVKV